MKLTVNTKSLAKELEFIEKPLKLFTPNLTFKNVLFEVNNDKVRLTTSNGMNILTSSEVTLDAPVAESVSFTVPCDRLKDLIKLFDLEKVTFSVTENNVTMSAGKSKYRFNITPTAAGHIKQYSELPIEGETFTADANKFVDAVSVAVNFASKTEQSQYTLHGVEVSFNEETITARASDGVRGAEFVKEDKNEGRNTDVFLQRDGITAITDLAVGATDLLTVVKGNNRYRFTSGTRKVDISRCAVEKFPNIGFMFSKCEGNQILAEVECKPFSLAVQRLQTAAAGQFNKLLMTIDDGKVSLRMAGFGDAINEGDEEVAANTTGTGKCSINAGYVLDFTKHANGGITIKIGETGPTLFKHNSGLRCMILQMA